MEVRETVLNYNYNKDNEIKIEESEIPQYLKDKIDRGLADIEAGRVLEHEEAMKLIRKKLGFDEE